MRNLKLLLSYLGKYRRDAILGILFVTIETVLELFIPVIMANIIDVGVPGRDIPYIMLQGTLMLLCALVSLALGLGYSRAAARVAVGLGANLRAAEYQKIQTLAFGNLDEYETSSLVTRMTTDITVIQNAVGNGFRPMVRGPVNLVMGLVYAFVLSRELAAVFAVILPVLAIILAIITVRVSPLYRQLQTSMDHLNGVVQEDLTAVRAVKAYVRADHECAKFDGVNTELADTATRTFGTAVLNLPAFQASMYVAAVTILWIGGRMIIAGKLGVGSLTGFMSYVLLIMNSLMMISNVFLLLTRALTSVGRISEVLDERPLIESPTGADALRAPTDGGIEFRDVSFKYRANAAEDVLEHVSLRIESGSTVGVLGGTGSGKSSLVQLIARLYGATEGTVFVGGRDVRDYDLAVLRDAVGIVLQKNVLFTGTVRENLLWGNENATDEELLEACRAACVDEFLDRIGGLDGDLGQGGAGVSGGQKQRLCIARTLLKHPRVLIFDDSTSAVDMATEAKIRENLSHIPGVTTIIIAQRITSVMDADRIIVIDDGQVHGQGTHAELLANDSIYQEIYASQMEFAGDDGDVKDVDDRAAAAAADADSAAAAAGVDAGVASAADATVVAAVPDTAPDSDSVDAKGGEHHA